VVLNRFLTTIVVAANAKDDIDRASGIPIMMDIVPHITLPTANPPFSMSR
jgi:hypothetical protein